MARFSRAVEICKRHLDQSPDHLAGRSIYARALYHAGQIEVAEKEFMRLLACDADNIVVHRYLGDIKHARGDFAAATAHYERILLVDPHCQALADPVVSSQRQMPPRTIAIKRPAEIVSDPVAHRRIPFFTETIGDLYLSQGYPRLAAEVFRTLHEKQASPRLNEKLQKATQSFRDKEH